MPLLQDGPSEVGAIPTLSSPFALVGTALALTAALSNNYVPTPAAEEILADQIDTIKDVRCRVRARAEIVKLRPRENEEETNVNAPNTQSQQPQPPLPTILERARRSDDGDDANFWIDINPEERVPAGFGTGLYD